MEIIKKCNKCKEIKNLLNFRIRKNSYLNRGAICNKCINFERNLRYKNDSDYRTKKKNREIKRVYGEKALALKKPKNCPICLRSEDEIRDRFNRTFAIDHCHKTGNIRGYICMACNSGLGYFKDNQISIQKAIEYLIANKGG